MKKKMFIKQLQRLFIKILKKKKVEHKKLKIENNIYYYLI